MGVELLQNEKKLYYTILDLQYLFDEHGYTWEDVHEWLEERLCHPKQQEIVLRSFDVVQGYYVNDHNSWVANRVKNNYITEYIPVITEYEIDFRNVRGDRLTYNPIPLECGQLFTLELNDFSSDNESGNVDGLTGLGGRL
jgi:hypothetical protein